MEKINKTEENNDIFIRYLRYPQVKNIFSTSIIDIDILNGDSIIVVDTNILLQLYKLKESDLKEIKEVFRKLVDSGRLIIPGQVAREFIDQRENQIHTTLEKFRQYSEKLKQSKKQLQNLLPSFNFNIDDYLVDDNDFQELQNLEEDLIEVESDIRKGIETLIKDYKSKFNHYHKKFIHCEDKIKQWKWRDPISSIYAELFTDNVIVDFDFNLMSKYEIEKELDLRYKHKIPPGFEDRTKPDKGIGDFLIWLTILQIAKKEMKDIVFVSGEQKRDWFFQTSGKALYPRFELINEFKSSAPKCNFSIIDFSKLLESFKVSSDVLENVPMNEKAIIETAITNENDTVMRMVLANQSLKVNEQYNIYYHTISRGFRPHQYIGLYSNKAIRFVGKIENIIAANRAEDGKLEIKWSSKEVSVEQKQRISNSIDEAIERNWEGVANDHIFFLVEDFYKTEFRKTSKRAPMGPKIFNLKRELGMEQLPKTQEIAKMLEKKTWV